MFGNQISWINGWKEIRFAVCHILDTRQSSGCAVFFFAKNHLKLKIKKRLPCDQIQDTRRTLISPCVPLFAVCPRSAAQRPGRTCLRPPSSAPGRTPSVLGRQTPPPAARRARPAGSGPTRRQAPRHDALLGQIFRLIFLVSELIRKIEASLHA